MDEPHRILAATSSMPSGTASEKQWQREQAEIDAAIARMRERDPKTAARIDELGAECARQRVADAMAARRRLSRPIERTPPENPMAPTRERVRKAEIRPPAVDQETRRDAHEVVDVFEKYGGRRTWDGLRVYALARISEEAAGLAASGCEPRVDGGGWRSYGGIEALPDKFHEQSANLAKVHQQLDRRKVRAAFDALTDAMRFPRNPCPLEQFVGQYLFPGFHPAMTKEAAMVQTLDWMAEQIRG